MNKKKITVLIPICNERIDFLKKSIQSIINQTNKNWQCLIIFEGDNKKNLNYLKDIKRIDKRFKLVIPKKKLGLAGSLNLGLKLADTEFIARFDSDDIMQKNRLQNQQNFLEKNSNISVVGSNLKIINNKDKEIGKRDYPDSGKKLLINFILRCGLAHPSVMFRLKDVISVGMYNEKLNAAEDLDLWLRMIRKGFNLYNIQEPLLYYRKSEFRSKKHWLNVYKVRKENIGTFNTPLEKIILLCFRILILIRN